MPVRCWNGQVAQSVEQGIENPRVGGSIPSLATFLCLLIGLGSGAGCGAEPCLALCSEVADRLDGCLGTWGADWEDFGAEDERGYRVACQDGWDAARADLEVRQVPEADDRCSAASESLAGLDCAQLAVLYPAR